MKKSIVVLLIALLLCVFSLTAYAATATVTVNNPTQLPAEGGFSGTADLAGFTLGGEVTIQYSWDGSTWSDARNYTIVSDPDTPSFSGTVTSTAGPASLRVQVVEQANHGNVLATANTVSVTVLPLLSAGTISTSNATNAGYSTYMAGESVQFSASPSGGSGSYSYAWDFGNGATSNAVAPAQTFASAGGFTVTLTLTDTANNATATATLPVTIQPALAVTVAANPAAGPYHTGGTVTLTPTATGGKGGGYSYGWTYTGGTGPATGDTAALTLVEGVNTATCTVTDGDGRTAALAAPISITATAAPAALAVSLPVPGALPVGGSYTFTANTTGGTAPYTYQWTLDGAAQASTDNTLALTNLPAGNHTVQVTATDSAGATASQSVPFSVGNALAVTLSAPPATLKPGDTPTFTAYASGGDPATYAYAWTLDGQSVVGNGASITLPGLAAGNHTLQVTLTDGAGSAPAIAQVTLNVPNTLTVSLTGPSGTIKSRYSLVSTATPSGGQAPYTYRWYLNDKRLTNKDTATISYTPDRNGSFTLQVTVLDATGAAATASTKYKIRISEWNTDASPTSEPTQTIQSVMRSWGYAVDSGYSVADLLALGQGGVVPTGTQDNVSLTTLGANLPQDTVLLTPTALGGTLRDCRLVMLWPAKSSSLSVSEGNLVYSTGLVALPSTGTLTRALTLQAAENLAWPLETLFTPEQMLGELSIRPLGDQGALLLSFDAQGGLIGGARLLLLKQNALVLLPVADGATAFALSPDGSRLAFRKADGDLQQLTLGTLESIPIANTQGGTLLEYLPSGQLMVGMNGRYAVTTSGRQSQTFNGPVMDNLQRLAGNTVDFYLNGYPTVYGSIFESQIETNKE